MMTAYPNELMRAQTVAPKMPTKRVEGWTREGLRRDIASVRRYYANSAQFEQLKRPRPWSILQGVALSWLIILLAWGAVVWFSSLLIPLALIVIGSRQRVLGNALHDSAHGNGVRSRRINQWLLAAPVFEDFEVYRRTHLAHHAYLGDATQDPDYLEVPACPENGPLTSWRIYSHYLFKGSMWKASVFGEIPALGNVARCRIAVFWASVLSLLVLSFGVRGLSFAALWMGARATTYHLTKVFTELADHVGLIPGSIFSFTRTSPSNWLSAILHPHSDNYHLAHHLVPRVPTHKLPELHRMLLEISAYRQGHHCESYFRGVGSVAQGWLHATSIQAYQESNNPLVSAMQKGLPHP